VIRAAATRQPPLKQRRSVTGLINTFAWCTEKGYEHRGPKPRWGNYDEISAGKLIKYYSTNSTAQVHRLRVLAKWCFRASSSRASL
jgi:hypothetical protein